MMSAILLPKSLALVLIIITVFTVSLTENLQIADGFSASGAKIIFDVNPGETAVHEWMLRNVLDESIGIEVYTVGQGSEFLTFEKLHILEPGQMINPEIIISIPKDHPDNIEYKVELYALKRAPELEAGVTGIAVNSQLKSFINIYIGDNPIYTPPPVAEVAVLPDVPIVKTQPKAEKGEEPVPVVVETLQEKLKRINEANEQVVVDDTWEETFEESFEEEAVPDYEPEPTIEYEVHNDIIPEPGPGAINQEEKECDFFAWLMSLFGMAKC